MSSLKVAEEKDVKDVEEKDLVKWSVYLDLTLSMNLHSWWFDWLAR